MTTNLAKLTADIQRSQATYRDLSETARRSLDTLRTNPSLIEDDNAVIQMIKVIEGVIKSLNTLSDNINSIDTQFKSLVVKNISKLKEIGEGLTDSQNQIYYNRVIKSGFFGGYRLNNKNMAMPSLPSMPGVIDRLSQQVARAAADAKLAKKEQRNQARRNAQSARVARRAQQNANRRERVRLETQRRQRELSAAQERKRRNNEAKAAANRLQAQLIKESRQQKLTTLAKEVVNKGNALGGRFSNTNGNRTTAFGGGGGVP